MIFLATLLAAVLLTIALIPLFSRLAIRCNALDQPNDRKVHLQPIPRIGGAAMAAGTFVPLFFNSPLDVFSRSFVASGGVLVLFGLVDDFRELSPRIKFVGQILAATIIVVLGGLHITTLGAILPDEYSIPPWLAIPFTIFVIVGVTNAINLSDGLDGLAGGICLLSFLCIGFLAYLDNDKIIGMMSLALAGAIFGFLRFNTHPASVFMGDTGSQLLGFSAITLSLSLTQGDPSALSPLLPLIILGFPVLDTLTVMVIRIAKGRSPFSPDKNHFHHILLGLGFKHPESVLIIYLCQGVLIVAAFMLRYHSEWLLFSGYLVFSAIVLGLLTVARRTGWQLKRYDLLDIIIVGRLRRLRDDGMIIRILFRVFKWGIPLLFCLSCFITNNVPAYVSRGALGLAAVIAVAWLLRKEWLDTVVRIILYVAIPFVIYFGEASPVAWVNDYIRDALTICFAVFAVFIILVSRFSRRKEGFKSTPLDFLILFIIVIFPNLQVMELQEYRLGLVAAKVIMLYFSYEVLFAEMRKSFRGISVLTMISLLIFGLRSIV